MWTCKSLSNIALWRRRRIHWHGWVSTWMVVEKYPCTSSWRMAHSFCILRSYVTFSYIQKQFIVVETGVVSPVQVSNVQVLSCVTKGFIDPIFHFWDKKLSVFCLCDTCVRFFPTPCDHSANLSTETTQPRTLLRLLLGCGGLSTNIFIKNIRRGDEIPHITLRGPISVRHLSTLECL